jgi:aspartyl protease family protein
MKTLALLLSLLAPLAALAAASSTLTEQIQQLGRQHGFEVSGLRHTEELPAEAASGGPVEQIKQLLKGFNYVLVGPPERKPERLIILSRKSAAPPPPPEPEVAPAVGETSIPTERQGAHHMVQATLRGEGGNEVPVTLMVDTGASLVVLPSSLAPTLLADPAKLQTATVQTAKGRVEARVGKLPSMRIGDQEVAEVEVGFIEDPLLGGHALLGMSVLGRFKITLDQQQNALILTH